MGGSDDVVPAGVRARRWRMWLAVAVLLVGAFTLVRHFVMQGWTREEILRLSRGSDSYSVIRMADLAMRHPGCWSHDPEIVEAIASSCSDEVGGWYAERALMHAEVGGPSWRRVVARTLEDDLLEFDDDLVFSAVCTVRRQRRPLARPVVEALAQRLRWACQDRDKDVGELVRGIVEVLTQNAGAYEALCQSLAHQELAWLHRMLRGDLQGE